MLMMTASNTGIRCTGTRALPQESGEPGYRLAVSRTCDHSRSHRSLGLLTLVLDVDDNTCPAAPEGLISNERKDLELFGKLGTPQQS